GFFTLRQLLLEALVQVVVIRMIDVFERVERMIVVEGKSAIECAGAKRAARKDHRLTKPEGSRTDAPPDKLRGSDDPRNQCLVGYHNWSRRLLDAVEIRIIRVGHEDGRLANEEDVLKQPHCPGAIH